MDNGTESKTAEQVKPEEKPEAKPEEKPAVKPEAKQEEKPAVKSEEKPDEKFEVKSEIKPAVDEVKSAAEDKTERDEAEKTETEKNNAEEEKEDGLESEKPSEELLEKIRSQVEFYFGDINLQRDKFLIEQTKLDEGWIPMTIMLNFKLLVSMSKDARVILEALKSSEIIEISEDRKKIRRSPKYPLPVFDEAYRKVQAERTVYVKGFPQQDIYIQKLKEFFKDYEPFENIIMRKYLDKEKKLRFKGSIFVQFKTLEGAKAFMARESVKYGDTELVRKYSEDYAVEKAKENEAKKQKKNEKKGGGKTSENNHDEADEANEETAGKLDLPKGAIVHFTIPSGQISREMIKQRFMDVGSEVAFIHYKKGDSEGWVRLQEANTGKAFVDKMEDRKLIIEENELTLRVLEGEEEEKYLAAAEQAIKESKHLLRLKNKNSKRPKRGRNNFRGRKRHGSPARGGGAAKKHASE